MDERTLRGWIVGVKDGRVSRRQFTRLMVGAGLTAPLAAEMLAFHGVPREGAAQTRPAFTPTRRGAGGDLKVLWWQGPTILNPHLSIGVKDGDGSRIFLRAADLVRSRGQLRARPCRRGSDSPERRHRAERAVGDLEAQTERPVARWPGRCRRTTSSSRGSMRPTRPRRRSLLGDYKDIARIEKLDAHTFKIVYKAPIRPGSRPSAARPASFRSTSSSPSTAAKARRGAGESQAGRTGPYRILDFKPGDSIRAKLNPSYHEANWPFFDRLELKGGGDAVSAARAVSNRRIRLRLEHPGRG